MVPSHEIPAKQDHINAGVEDVPKGLDRARNRFALITTNAMGSLFFLLPK
jgi:hypothetical protein